jgi:hypothetical protein
MPKPNVPDQVLRMDSLTPEIRIRRWTVHADGTTSIERYAKQQRDRAEKAEVENARLREALGCIKQHIEAGTFHLEEVIVCIVDQALHPTPEATNKENEDE